MGDIEGLSKVNIHDKLKKTYKNRYFLFKNQSNKEDTNHSNDIIKEINT